MTLVVSYSFTRNLQGQFAFNIGFQVSFLHREKIENYEKLAALELEILYVVK